MRFGTTVRRSGLGWRRLVEGVGDGLLQGHRPALGPGGIEVSITQPQSHDRVLLLLGPPDYRQSSRPRCLTEAICGGSEAGSTPRSILTQGNDREVVETVTDA